MEPHPLTMNNTKHITLYFLLSFLFLSIGLSTICEAQTIKLQVVTRTIEKQFEWQKGEPVILEGEKANISIQNWSGSSVKVILKQIAKAPSRAVAEKELNYQKYILETRRTGIRIKNYFVIPKQVKATESILKSEYEVWLPKNCPISINNSYGNITMKSASGMFNINNKYGNIVLEQVSGNLNIESYFGDLAVKGFDGKMWANCNHTLINLIKASGELRLKTTLGDVLIGKASQYKKLEIEASKADVTLEQTNWPNADIQLETKYGDIIVPLSKEKYFTDLTESKKALVRQDKSAVSKIRISATFGKIIAN